MTLLPHHHLEPALLVADCLKQLSDGLTRIIVMPTTISSPAAAPSLQHLISTPDANLKLATLLPTVPVTYFKFAPPFGNHVPGHHYLLN